MTATPATPGSPAADATMAVLGGGWRLAWEGLPPDVRAAIEGVCGSPVVASQTQPGGFSPGVAARVRCADGSRHFVKAVSGETNEDSPVMHRREAATIATLDPFIAAGALPASRLRGTVELGPWVAVVLSDIDGHLPRLPWRETELRQVLATLGLLAEAVTPAPDALPTVAESHAGSFVGWRTLAGAGAADLLDPWSRAHLDQLAVLEASWETHASGPSLVHSDVRADNLLFTTDSVWLVDWAHACRGAPFVDVVLMAPCVAMQGGPGPADLVAMAPTARGTDSRALAAVVCALAGYLTERALRPAPPGLPTIRAFQAAQGEVTRRWLASLL